MTLQKLNKKIILLFIFMLSALCFSGCTNQEQKGIDELLVLNPPEGYHHEKNDVYDEQKNLVSIHYGNKKTSVCYIILSFDGKAVMGSDETFREWYENAENIAEEVPIKGADTNACILPTGFNADNRENVEKSVIEAVFEYQDHLIMIGMFNNQSEPLTINQKKMFKNIINTLQLKK